ncbi:MAG: chlorophyllase/cutinase-like alpha/beta fold protein, partial [Pseudonocardiaceae bacterium]
MITSGTRRLTTTLRYPATTAGTGTPPARGEGPYPIVVFSQGFAIPAEAYANLLDRWAADGFVVADPTYPLTAPESPGGLDESDIVRHPSDLTAVITAVIQEGSTPGTLLSSLVDARRIGVAGHSDGGDVTEAVAADTCCHDPRVGAAVVLSGAELTSMGGTYT